MSVLADSFGPACPPTASPSISSFQQFIATAALQAQGVQQQPWAQGIASMPQDREVRKNQQADADLSSQQGRSATNVVGHDHISLLSILSDGQVDSSLDYLSSLVDFELFDEIVHSPLRPSPRKNSALANLDTFDFLSQEVRFDAPSASRSSLHTI